MKAITYVARLHRVLGLVLFAFVLVWFISGFVMLFSTFPRVDAARKTQALARLDPAAIDPALLQFVETAPARAQIEMLPNGPIARRIDGTVQTFRAGATLTSLVSPIEARLVAMAYVARGNALLQVEPRACWSVEKADQWTLGNAIQPRFPLLACSFANSAADQVYVSLVTGEVVQHTTSNSRLLAWTGSIPHWIYPAFLRRQREVWRWVVIVLGSLACGLSVMGWWLGWRLRQTMSRPVRKPVSRAFAWKRWHARIGLWGGPLIATWALSGALSLNPFHWSTGPSATTAEMVRYRLGSQSSPIQRTVPLVTALRACSERFVVKRITLDWMGGHPLFRCTVDGNPEVFVPGTGAAEVISSVPEAWMVDAWTALADSLEKPRVTLLREPDAYHYPSHFEPDPVLPAYRVEWRDPRILLYVDAHSGDLVRRYELSGRAERWLYHGLHSFDFPVLLQYPRLRWLLILTGLALGLLAVVTGTLVSLRRLSR
jgi:hypothetical protein